MSAKKKKTSLVDAFLFSQAKEVVDIAIKKGQTKNMSNRLPLDMANSEPSDMGINKKDTHKVKKLKQIDNFKRLDTTNVERLDMANGKPLDMANGEPLDTTNVERLDMANGKPLDMANRSTLKPAVNYNFKLMLTPIQFAVYNTIKSLKGKRTTQKSISTMASINYRTTRDSISYLKNNNVFSKYEVIRTADFQGISILIDPHVNIYVIHKNLINKSGGLPLDMANGEPLDTTNVERFAMSNGKPLDMANGEQCSSSVYINTTTYILDNIILYNYLSELNHLENFNKNTFVKFIDKFNENGFDDQKILETIQDFVDKTLYLKHQNKINDPNSILYSALDKGFINVDNNFISRKLFFERKKLEEKKKELEELKRIKTEMDNLEFELFKEKLTVEELESIEKEAEKKYTPKEVLSKNKYTEITMDEIIRKRLKDNRKQVDV